MRTSTPRNDFATVALVLALGGLVLLTIASKLSSQGLTEVCVGVGAAAIVMGGMGLRQAVRTDSGVARTLFGLGFGFVALVLATIVLGGQKGGQFSGLGPAPASALVDTGSAHATHGASTEPRSPLAPARHRDGSSARTVLHA